MENRYSRNFDTLSSDDMEILRNAKVCVVGCGGLGGYVLEHLARIGVLNITAIDYDVFALSNLNRQILSNEQNMDMKKVFVAKERISLVNSEVNFNPVCEKLDDENAVELFKNHDLIIDALDNLPARFSLAKAARQLNIPFVHGAVGGWFGQVSSVFPDDYTIEKIYPTDIEKGIEKKLGNLSCVVASVASYEVCEAVKILLKKENILRNKLGLFDFLNNEFNVIDI